MKVGQWIRFTACFDPVLNYYRISHFKPIPENFAVNGGNLRSFKVVRLNADDSDESKFAVKHSLIVYFYAWSNDLVRNTRCLQFLQ